MQFEVFNRWTHEVRFTAEIECGEDEPYSVRLGLAVKWALKTRADLSDADLSDADLSRANLSRADLSRADLTRADLSGADLSGADLSRADLTRADLSGADLSGADLSGADLTRADLTDANLSRADLTRADLSRARNDLWDVLIRARHEVPALLDALRAGKIDGSTYSGECACLVGTISNVRHVFIADLGNGLNADSNRPAERWFLGIRKGDTPETSAIAKITEGWLVEFLSLMSDRPADVVAA